MPKDLQTLQRECTAWTAKQFGENRSPSPPIAHLAKEVKELADDPFDRFEYADCLLLILDAANNAGISADVLLKTAFQKLEINKQRKWGKPNEAGFVEHVRD